MKLVKLYEAIESLTSNPFTIIGEDLENIIWESNDLPKPSSKEIFDEVKRIEKTKLEEENRRVTAKASAIAKLQDLGLTEDEAKAFLG